MLWLVFDGNQDAGTDWTLHVAEATRDEAPVMLPAIGLREGSRTYTLYLAP